MAPRPTHLALAAVAVLSSLSSSAIAAPLPDVAVTSIDFEGVASTVDQADIRHALLAAVGKRLVPDVGAADASGRAQEKPSEPRARIEFGKHFAARLLIEANVNFSTPAGGGAPTWSIESSLFDCEGADFIGFEQSTCPNCNREAFLAKIGEVINRLLQHDHRRSTARLTVKTNPTVVARLKIDGRAMGLLPFEETIFAGTHEIAVDADGYRQAKVTLNLEKDTPQTVMLPIEQVGKVLGPSGSKGGRELPRRSMALKAIGGSLIAAGAASAVVGIVDLAIDGNG